MPRFEYLKQPVTYEPDRHPIEDSDIARLNFHGKDGWELTAAVGPVMAESFGLAVVYFFKRPLPYVGSPPAEGGNGRD